ncbi:MAG TPA: response regulator [Polyangia bacterium]|nr:response regulator [Polyangia bacterium]
MTEQMPGSPPAQAAPAPGLPAAALAAGVTPGAPPPDTKGSRAGVLVVDDSLTVRMDLAEALESAGLRAVACASLREARAALAQGSIAVAILDVLLPDGDGLDLLQEIRSTPATAAIPVLMLSTEAEVRDRIRGLQTGATDYVGKPYDRGQIVLRARELAREWYDADRQAAPRRASILVIDDSVTFRRELGRVLADGGYGVLEAETGEQGLQMAADRRPSAIVVDGVLPGIDGATVIRRIRLDEALRGTPCLMLTASDAGQAELQALDAGADSFVSKGEDPDMILARLSALLRRSTIGRGDVAGALRDGSVAVARVGAPVASLLAPKRILAVDDSLTYLQALSGTLREEGYDVIQAHSGEEALAMLAAQPADCILLDLIMPGLGGREACRRIKALPAMREIPLVMLTALEDRQAMLEGLALGADDYISKSNDFSVLKARVRAQLRRKQFEDEHRRIREDLMRSELAATEARAAKLVSEARATLSDELERKNKELETFSYSVSHDLRAPLRAIDGFSQALLENHAAALDERGRRYLQRIRAGAQRMAELVDDLLELSRVSRVELHREAIDLAELARSVMADLQRQEPDRAASFVTDPDIQGEADRRLMRVVFENLLGNAWKFTAHTAAPCIELRVEARAEGAVYCVRDNGAGFDQTYAGKLFAPFQRLHDESEFPGTGIGLATVHRIIDRHRGRVWAEGAVGRGAAVFFTLTRARASS